EDAQSDRIDVFLQRRLGDHLGRLANARVDDFEAGVAQRAGDDLGAAVVAIQARLGDQNAKRRRLAHAGGTSTSALSAAGGAAASAFGAPAPTPASAAAAVSGGCQEGCSSPTSP